jgi:hypothetical protein
VKITDLFFNISEMKSGALENAYVTVWIEDGILMILYKKDAVVGLQAAKEIVALCQELAQGKLYPPLVYVKHLKVVSVDARKYFAKQGAAHLRGAVIVDSGFSRILGNMFSMINKPLTPMRMFTDKDAAIKWIKNG